MQVGKYPRVHLQHNQHWRKEGTLRILTYSLYPIPVPRPAAGVKTVSLRCGGCGAEIDVRVYSVRHTRWSRLLLLLAGVGGLVAMVVLAAMLVESDQSRPYDVPPRSSLFYLPAGLGLGALFTIATYALVNSFFYDGVRLPWFSGRGGHALRRPSRRQLRG
ncbi:hypothetical protein AB0J86_32795 [Micromonospora sp. NPDC049559]|uniref:hypothetical protein n=1 Tax=Micromonospora sp. NPDC049559 TaxID=3155923 RepID=UPI0034392348